MCACACVRGSSVLVHVRVRFLAQGVCYKREASDEREKWRAVPAALLTSILSQTSPLRSYLQASLHAQGQQASEANTNTKTHKNTQNKKQNNIRKYKKRTVPAIWRLAHLLTPHQHRRGHLHLHHLKTYWTGLLLLRNHHHHLTPRKPRPSRAPARMIS